jgi:hypothetical protein
MNGNRAMGWEITAGLEVSWLGADQTAGYDLFPGDSEIVDITFEPMGLEAGQYTSTLTIHWSDGVTEGDLYVDVTLDVLDPGMAIDPSTMEFSLDLTDGPLEDTQLMNIENDGTGDLNLLLSPETQSRIIFNRSMAVAVIDDGTGGVANITPILDEMEIEYEVFENNSSGTYTSDLDFLSGYDLIIWHGYRRGINQTEHDAVEAYIQDGGKILITGLDTLGYPDDPLMAALVRSSAYGDGPFSQTSATVENIHPIIDGEYGSWDVGHQFTWSSSTDHDNCEADVSAGAVTVLGGLESGFDKIIACEVGSGQVVYWNSNYYCNDIADSDDLANIFRNTVDWLGGSRGNWLSVDPMEGTILAGEDQDFAVTATTIDDDGNNIGIYAGEYWGAISIEHNDPDTETPYEVPVHLVVGGGVAIPNVWPLEFDTFLLSGETQVDELRVQNAAEANA